jgi:hypothetical protein
MSQLEMKLFGCHLGPPFFSKKPGEDRPDIDNKHLINKIRPLVAHQGQLMCISKHALFLGGLIWYA